MKKCVSMILAAVLLLTCICIGTPEAYAAEKKETSRAIAIVFDNSGSMYLGGNQAWCRATYAMEVFASMLNEGDTLRIYPMNPFSIGSKEYSMDKPLEITESAQANQIRDIVTPGVGDTHIESIDCAISGLKTMKGDEKYLIVLSDGDDFYENGKSLGERASIKGLNARFEKASEDIKMMYLGIGVQALTPDTANSEIFTKKKAENSADVLSALTEMCNQIFGRDILPESRHTETSMEFDVSMKKLIVFVQGTDIADLKITGDGVGTLASSQQVKYATGGSSHYTDAKSDTSLQGMMVTYTDCAAGSYSIDYSGSEPNVEVYYEPDVDLNFVFTHADGSEVDPNALYEGEYKVSFGMKDAKTGKLTNSELLGKPEYKGSYTVKRGEQSEETVIKSEETSGEKSVTLNMNDTFDANLTVTYLSGYTISKNATDFGWPEGGIKVAPRPVGEMKLEITGGDELYSLQELEKGSPYIAKVYLAGQQLTGKELKQAEPTWDDAASNAKIEKEFADDHWKLSLHYKDPESPKDTACGECTVPIFVSYTPKGSNEVQAQSPLTYNIEDDYSPLQIELFVPQSYIVIKELDASQAMVVDLTLNGAPLTAEEFALVQGLQVETSGIEYTLTPNEQKSSYQIKLVATEGIAEGDYPVSVKALYVDQIGREYESMEQTALITLSSMPLWMKWLIRIGLLLLLLIIIWIITHIKVMPKKVLTPNRVGTLKIGATDVDNGVTYPTKRSGSTLSVLCKKGAGTPFGIKMTVAPGSDSYLYKSSKKRSMEVQPTKVVLQNGGGETVTEANINGVRYKMDPVTHKFGPVQQNTKPFVLKNNANVKWSGTILDNGKQKSFSVTTKLDFKDKK